MSLALDLLQRTVIDNPFIPTSPTEPQAVFLTAIEKEILYGGAAGGGKSAALLMAALQWVHLPGYAAILLRRTYADLVLPDALIPMSHEWLRGTEAKWDGQRHEWRFPSGATLTFGYLDTEQDKYRYQGAAFQFIGFDELTQFAETQYRYLFSRCRRRETTHVPLRVRGATNPGGAGHDWVRKRFIDCANESRLFIPAALDDNPYLDKQSYEQSLAELDPVTRRQLRHGDWKVRPEGNMFKRTWFASKLVESAPAGETVRYWDLAATKAERGKEPDYAASCRMTRASSGFYIHDIQRFRENPRETELRFRATAERDGSSVPIRIEQEPGATSKLYIDSLARSMDAFDVRGVRSLNDKLTRARPLSAASERGDVYLVRGHWIDEFLDELCAFPEVGHDDQVDAATGAYGVLTNHMKTWGVEELGTVFDRRRSMKPKTPYEELMDKLKASRKQTAQENADTHRTIL